MLTVIFDRVSKTNILKINHSKRRHFPSLRERLPECNKKKDKRTKRELIENKNASVQQLKEGKKAKRDLEENNARVQHLKRRESQKS